MGTGQSMDTPTLPFLQNFEWAINRIGRVNVPTEFEVRSSVPETRGGT